LINSQSDRSLLHSRYCISHLQNARGPSMENDSIISTGFSYFSASCLRLRRVDAHWVIGSGSVTALIDLNSRLPYFSRAAKFMEAYLTSSSNMPQNILSLTADFNLWSMYSASLALKQNKFPSLSSPHQCTRTFSRVR